MLFSLFQKKKTVIIFTDKTYISSAARKNACVALARENENILFIAWFAQTAKEFRETFTHNQLPENRIIEVRNLHSAKINNYTPVFLEHFPLYAKEEELVKNWDVKKLDVYNSLDEPLFKYFGGDKIIALMKQMGIKEEEVIEHSLISKSIRNGQENLAKKINFEQSASSQKEWIEKNIG